jgi:hypothetical protein
MTTPRTYRPDKKYEVAMAAKAGKSTTVVVADKAGRLHLEVPLGPSNTSTGESPEALVANAAGSGNAYTTTVTIDPA